MSDDNDVELSQVEECPRIDSKVVVDNNETFENTTQQPTTTRNSSSMGSSTMSYPEINDAYTFNNHLKKVKKMDDTLRLYKNKWYCYLGVLFLSCLPSFLFIFPCFFIIPDLESKEPTDRTIDTEVQTITLTLVSVSWVVVMTVVAIFLYATYKYKKYPLIKAQGNIFLPLMFATSALTVTISYISVVVSLYVYDPATFTTESLGKLPLGFRTMSTTLMILARYSHTVFMALLSGRIRVIYKLFVKNPSVKYTQKDNLKTMLNPIILELTIQTVVLIPFVVFSILLAEDETNTTYQDGYAISFISSLWIVAVVRGVIYLYFTIKVRKVDTIFSNYQENFRLAILDLVMWIGGAIAMTILDSQTPVFLIPMMLFQIMTLDYLIDTLFFPLYLAWKDERRTRNGNASGMS